MTRKPPAAVPTSSTKPLLSRRLELLGQSAHAGLLERALHGIEKESLRVTMQGALAQTSHPRALGSALTNPQLTTDYSEALLEFVTPTDTDVAATLGELDTLHRFVYAEIGDEMLWNESMPCPLPEEALIPIARFGTSNIGRLKEVYRNGLSLRYGRAMQCIAGIHYNYSLPDELWQTLQADEGQPGTALAFQSASYFAMIRNFRRTSWLLMYLFGASPAVDRNFLRGRAHALDTLERDTLYLPFATSLRMSDLGYQNNPAQVGLLPDYDSLDNYLDSLARAVSMPHPPYEKFGTKGADGEWLQLNTNVLQIENEFYSNIRPKRVTHPGERPLQALSARGVQYIEVRCMDIDPFEPVGIALPTARFLDAFLLFCALDDSPLLAHDQHQEAGSNFSRVVKEGRRPGLALSRAGSPVALTEWAGELLSRIEPAARLLDSRQGGTGHMEALAAQRAKLDDASLTPSAKVLAALREGNTSFTQFATTLSQDHAARFRARPLGADAHERLRALARDSLEQQARMEQSDKVDFDLFVAAYSSYTLHRGQV